MPRFYAVILSSLILLTGATSSQSAIKEEKGDFPLKCGVRSVDVQYRTLIDETKPFDNRFAILIDGSPTTKFFSDNGGNYEKIAESLLSKGFKLLEIKYPKTSIPLPDSIDAVGFYAACLNQGLEAIVQHEGDLYDAGVEILKYDAKNTKHTLVGLGFSIGAIKLQAMTFILGKPFDRIGLTGVLFGDVENGCIEGVKQDYWLSQVGESITLEEYFQKNLFEGISWASFLHLAQQVSQNGQGCCIEGPSIYGSCKEGTKNEFVSSFNFEKQRFFTSSNLAMFEGTKTRLDPDTDDDASPNPGQVHYIASKRLAFGAPTQSFFYDGCGHSVINCGGDKAVSDMVNFLASDQAE